MGAAHCELWSDEGEGGVRRLATVGAGRGIGLGRALLLAAFAAFRERAGWRSAELGVQADNDRAVALYESVGMRMLWRVDRWQRG